MKVNGQKRVSPHLVKRNRRNQTQLQPLVNSELKISDTPSLQLKECGVYLYKLKLESPMIPSERIENGNNTIGINCIFEKIKVHFDSPIFYERDGIPIEIINFFENAFKGYYSIANNYFYVGNPLFICLMQKACNILKKRFSSVFDKLKYELRFITDFPFLTQMKESTYYDILMFIPTVARCKETSNNSVIRVGETIRDISSIGQYNTNVVWTSEAYKSTGECSHGAKKIILKHKLGRNSFCPCGSEKKFKKCCGKM